MVIGAMELGAYPVEELLPEAIDDGLPGGAALVCNQHINSERAGHESTSVFMRPTQDTIFRLLGAVEEEVRRGACSDIVGEPDI